jgi:hypothetical protein
LRIFRVYNLPIGFAKFRILFEMTKDIKHILLTRIVNKT